LPSDGVTCRLHIDWKKVDEAIGRTAAVSSDVHSYGFPRTDLHVTLDGVTIKPALSDHAQACPHNARRRDRGQRVRQRLDVHAPPAGGVVL